MQKDEATLRNCRVAIPGIRERRYATVGARADEVIMLRYETEFMRASTLILPAGPANRQESRGRVREHARSIASSDGFGSCATSGSRLPATTFGHLPQTPRLGP